MMDPCIRTCGCRCPARRAISAARQGLLEKLCDPRAVRANLQQVGPAQSERTALRPKGRVGEHTAGWPRAKRANGTAAHLGLSSQCCNGACIARNHALQHPRQSPSVRVCGRGAPRPNLRLPGPVRCGGACTVHHTGPASRLGRSVRVCECGALRPDLRLPRPVREQRILGRQQRLVQVVNPDLPAQGTGV